MTYISVHSGQPYAYESITVGDSAVGLTADYLAPDGAAPPIAALLSLETAAIRFRMDGTDPTSSEGHLLASGDELTISSINALRAFRAIRDTETNGTLRVTYLR